MEKYQRQSIECNQSLMLELIHSKNVIDVADCFHTSSSTVIRRYDAVNANMLQGTEQLPEVIAIDEYRGDAGGEKYQTIIADPINRNPLEILADRKKSTVQTDLQKYGRNGIVTDS